MSSVHDLAKVDLNLLVALDVLTETGSVTVAAERLGVTQSAMSHTLRRLRVLLEDPLLVRSGTGMVLTPRAEALREPVRSALSAVGRALVVSEGFVPSASRRTFRVVSAELFDLLILPGLMADISAEAPEVGVAAAPGGAVAALLPRLEQGEVDVAVVSLAAWSSRPEGAELVQQVLLADEYLCFVRRGHPALRQGRLSLEAYLAAGHVLAMPDDAGPGTVRGLLAARGLQRRVTLRVPGLVAASRAVAETDLMLTAPASLRGALGELPVEAVPPPLPLERHALGLLWHRRWSPDEGHRWLRERITTAAQLAGSSAPLAPKR